MRKKDHEEIMASLEAYHAHNLKNQLYRLRYKARQLLHETNEARLSLDRKNFDIEMALSRIRQIEEGLRNL